MTETLKSLDEQVKEVLTQLDNERKLSDDMYQILDELRFYYRADPEFVFKFSNRIDAIIVNAEELASDG